MLDILRRHIIERLGNDVGNIDYVLQHFTPIKAKRNQQLLTKGEVCRHVYFVAEGCLQVYVYDVDANETTRDLVVENNWCSELISFGTGNPSNENIKAVEPSLLYAVTKDNFQHLVKSVPQFDKVYKQVLEASYANSVYRINSFVSLSALERVKWLMTYRPKLMSRLSSKLIASYLGISQETFSRLKSKL